MKIEYKQGLGIIEMIGDVEEGDLSLLKVAVAESDMTRINDESKSITLVINTLGGCAYECLAICEYLESLRHKKYEINTVAQAKVMSAGVPIWVLGTKRSYDKTTIFGIHSVQSCTEGSIDTVIREVDLIKRINNEYFKFISRYTDVDKAFLRTLLTRNTMYFLMGDEWGDLISGKTSEFKDFDTSEEN